MASSGRTVVSLPRLTNMAHQAKSTKQTACVDAYQPLPYFSQAWHKPVVHLVWCTNAYRRRACDECSRLVGLDLITNHYQSANLGLTFDCTAFTNLYHRGDGQGIDLGE